MEDNNLKNQFSADLLGAVSKVLGEAKQKPYVSSDKEGAYVIDKNGKTRATFSKKEHGKDCMTAANAHLKSNYEKYMKEDAEQIDELKASTVRSYRGKASADKENAEDERDFYKAHGDKKGVESATKRINKRADGINMANDKLTGGNRFPVKIRSVGEEVSLDEKHGGADYAIYHKSYTDAVDHALSHHGKSGLSVSDDDKFHHIGLMSKKPSEGNTTTLNLPATDHATGKEHTIHMQVYNRGGSHPYELNTYSSKNSTQRQIDKATAKRKKALGEDTIEEKLIGGQAKLDVDKDGKLEKSDFMKLRNKKIAAKAKEKDCSCDDDDDKMDEAYGSVRVSVKPNANVRKTGDGKAVFDALAKLDATKQVKKVKEEVEKVDEIFFGVVSSKMLPNNRKGPNPYDGANLKPGKSLGAALKHLDKYKKANPEKFKEEAELDESFSDSHIEQLRKAYSGLKTIDPSSDSYKRLKKLLDTAPQHHIKKLAGANIPFVSTLAQNRVKSVKEEVELDEGRGRPAKPGSAAYIAQQKAKEAGEAEGPEPDEHIMNQVRKAADSGMMPHKIKYADGSTHSLHRVHARAIIAKYNRLKPFAKEEMQAEIAKSHEHMMKHVKD